MGKVLSIIIPTYNMEVLLPRCLDSFIVTEEYMNKIEIFVINDGSKDSSSRIAHEYERKYPNTIKVIDKTNGNYGSCINVGLKYATGKYFKICDSDDFYENKNLAEFVTFLSLTNSDIVFSPYNRVDSNNNIIQTFSSLTKYEDKEFLLDDLNWDDEYFKQFVVMHAMAIKTELLKNNNYEQSEGISYTDSQFVFYSSLYSTTCSFFKKHIYNYYIGREGQSISITNGVKSYMQFFQNAEKMLDDYITIKKTISENKRKLLLRPIVVCLSIYASIVLCHIYDSKAKLLLLENMLKKAQNSSNNKCNIEDYLMQDKIFKLWRRFSVPAKFFYILMSLKYRK